MAPAALRVSERETSATAEGRGQVVLRHSRLGGALCVWEDPSPVARTKSGMHTASGAAHPGSFTLRNQFLGYGVASSQGSPFESVRHTIQCRAMKQRIVGFHQDEEHHWVAELACGHVQHTRHAPPWINRPWVLTPQGRAEAIGGELECRRCDEDGAPG